MSVEKTLVRAWLDHIPVDAVSLDQALGVIATLVERGAGGTVSTPNVAASSMMVSAGESLTL